MPMIKLPGRVTKTVAREMWEKDIPFVACPWKCRVFDWHTVDGHYVENSLGMWSIVVVPQVEKTNFKDFDTFCSHAERMICNTLLGNYLAFYTIGGNADGSNRRSQAVDK